MTPTVDIRTPELSDADRLAWVHLKCWRQAYPGILSPSLLASFTLEERIAAWNRILRSDTATRFAAEIDGEIVGFAASGPARRENPPRTLELVSIYVLAEYHGTGVGQALIEAAIGDSPALVWVAEGNARAQAFYRRNGFRADGGRGTVSYWEDMPEIRMVR